MESLEGNQTLEYIHYLETMQENLQKQLKLANSKVQDAKVVNASMLRSAKKLGGSRPATANK